MPNVSAAVFVAKQLTRTDVTNRRVLDVGSCDYNGSVAPLIKLWQPREYIGVDIVPGRGVDIVCSAEQLVQKFGPESFDIVLCIEVIEHSAHWQCVVSNLKQVLRPGGKLLVTTRSRGYAIHGFPNDYWRYEKEDFEHIFADFENRQIETDPVEPGVFFSGDKPTLFKEQPLSTFALYSVLTNMRCCELPKDLFFQLYYNKVRLKQKIRNLAYSGILGTGRQISRMLGIR